MSSPGVTFLQVESSLTTMLAEKDPNTLIPKIIAKMTQINGNCAYLKHDNDSSPYLDSCYFLRNFGEGRSHPHFLPYLYAALEVLGIKPNVPNWNYKNIKEWDERIDLTKFFEQKVVNSANNNENSNNNSVREFAAVPINSAETTAAKAKIVEDIKNTFQKIKAEFECPIGYSTIKNPAVTSAGQIYERGAIEAHLATQQKKNLTPTDPVTNEQISATLYPLMLPRKISPLIDELEKQVALLSAAQSAPAPAPQPNSGNNAELIKENARLQALVQSLQAAKPMQISSSNNNETNYNENNCDWIIENLITELVNFPPTTLNKILGCLMIPLNIHSIEDKEKKVTASINHLIANNTTRQTIVDACEKSGIIGLADII